MHEEDNKLMREQLQSLINRGFDIFGEEDSESGAEGPQQAASVRSGSNRKNRDGQAQ